MLYEMTIENELLDGVYAISLVDSPAIQEDFVLLSKDEKIHIELKADKIIDKKKKIVCGAVLIPDQVIPRKGYDIVFRKETIRKISENFIINGNKDNVTLQHQIPVNKVNLVESWIVEDTEKDKSAFLGYNLPVGTWFASYKINDDELWSEYIESGMLKGFSLEGSFTQKEIHMHDESCIHEHENIYEELHDLLLQIEFNPKNLDEWYVWRIGDNDNQCPACLKFRNQARTLRSWLKVAVPRVQDGTVVAGLTYTSPYGAGKYGTYCEADCNCRLIKIPTPPAAKKNKSFLPFLPKFNWGKKKE